MRAAESKLRPGHPPGTVNEKSGQYDPSTGTLSFSYTPYSVEAGGSGAKLGEGVIAGVYPTHPGQTEFEKFVSRIAVGNQNVNAFVLQVGLQVAANGVGRAIGAGVKAILAARAAGETTVDVANLSAKILRQMRTRGWTTQEILDTVKNGKAYAVVNKATGGAATEYVGASGKFVVVDNTTKQVLQVSGPGFLPNHP